MATKNTSPTISPRVAQHQHGGRMTAGYKVVLDEEPVFVGTFAECAMWGDENLPRGTNWMVRDARGLVI